MDVSKKIAAEKEHHRLHSVSGTNIFVLFPQKRKKIRRFPIVIGWQYVCF